MDADKPDLLEEAVRVKEGSPLLFLGVLNTGTKFKSDSVLLDHQTAGIFCSCITARGILLRPKARTLAGMQLIERHWFDTSLGGFGATLDEVLFYRMQLRDLIHPNADCNMSYSLLQEGAYPIDPTLEVLREICEDDLPDSLDDMLSFASPLASVVGCVGRWKCMIIAENSD